jgi:hypothetical protein
VESGAGHVDIFCLLSFFSIKKRLGVTVTSMAVTVTVIVSVIMASVREFMATKNSQLNYIEDKAGNSSHKHNVFLDFGRSLESSIGSK